MLDQRIETEDRWAIVELMGHQKIAGRVSTEAIGGASFLRVDVPETPELPAFTKLFGGTAIYGITFVSQEVATVVAKGLRKEAVTVYELPAEYANAMRQMKSLAHKSPPVQTDGFPVFEDEDE